MHDNRNKNAMKRVEKGMMKANSTRNLFAMSAIILTTFMITTVFSLAINYIENMNLMQMRTLGTAADVSLAMPTKEQEQQITSLDYVKTVGVRYMAGSISKKNAEGREFSIVLQYYDTTEWEKHYQKAISGFVGKYPANENEIMLSEDALSQLGIKAPELYMEIPLSYSHFPFLRILILITAYPQNLTMLNPDYILCYLLSSERIVPAIWDRPESSLWTPPSLSCFPAFPPPS